MSARRPSRPRGLLRWWRARVGGRSPDDEIVVVTGLPRSGTSMMMRMLDHGGVPPLADGERRADEDNPLGYYEFERVKQLRAGDTEWVEAARGRAVKVISELLRHLPEGYRYSVVFMRRPAAEILASQRRMLENRGERVDASEDARMEALFERHLAEVAEWLATRPDMRVHYVDYRDVVGEPKAAAAAVADFLARDLDVHAMAAVVDPELYRQRRDRAGT